MLNNEDPLHINTKDYFKYFPENEILLKVSTITIAEYCVGGIINELPLINKQILPFNLDHAKRTEKFAKVIFDEKKVSNEDLKPRVIRECKLNSV